MQDLLKDPTRGTIFLKMTLWDATKIERAPRSVFGIKVDC